MITELESLCYIKSCSITTPTRWSVRPAKSDHLSSLCALWVANYIRTQTFFRWSMKTPIGLGGCHFVRLIMLRLITSATSTTCLAFHIEALRCSLTLMTLVFVGVAIMSTVNFLNIRTPKAFVVITLKFELCGSTIE